MSENPRQFSSIDSSDANLHGSLTNRPPSGAPAGDPIDFEALNRQIINQRTQQDYTYKESTAEYVLRREREIAAAQRIRQETADAQAARALQDQRNQAQRNELANRTSSAPSDPEVATARQETPLAQQQRSTPERQPLPSRGSPPPTMNGTAVRPSALVEPTATPAPAALKEAIGGAIGGIGQSLPKALPQSAGRLLIPGVGAGLTFAGALIAGQSVQQAATTTAVVTGSGFIGGVIGTAVGGPIGFYVGSLVGGFVGGYLANVLLPTSLSTTAAKQEDQAPRYVPFAGGQNPGLLYYVKIAYPGVNGSLSYSLSAPIRGTITAFSAVPAGNGQWLCIISYDNGRQTDTAVNSSTNFASPYIDSIFRVDGGVDYPPAGAGVPVAPPDNRPYYLGENPINKDNAIPSGKPAAGLNKGKNRDVAPSMPSNNVPNGGGIFPGHGGLAPSYLPNPEHQPSNLGGMLPLMQPLPQRQSLPFAEPEDIAVPRVSPTSEGISTTTATNPSTFAYPAYVPETAKPVPISDALSPVPKVKAAPITKTPTELSNDGIKTAIDQQQKDFNEKLGQLTAIATAIAAITPAIQGLPDAIANSPNVRAANKETTQGAVCEIAQPGGCLGNALDDSANKINQNNNQNTANLLDKINAGANAAQLALLELINTKLGDLLPGGLSATFTRLWQTLQVDRVISILTLITTFHNGLMLSNNLGQTLFAAIDNISQAAGFKWKNEKGEESGFSSIVSEWTANFFKSIFGEENYTELVAEYKKANRIYQATANIFNALQSIGYSILSALEVVGSYVALIGNALRKWGEVGESAYKWFNPQPNFHNKFFTTLEGATNVVSQIDQVASEVVSVEQNVAQIGELKNELGKSIGEDNGSKQGVQPPEAAKVKAGSDASKLVSATGLAIADLDKEADE